LPEPALRTGQRRELVQLLATGCLTRPATAVGSLDVEREMLQAQIARARRWALLGSVELEQLQVGTVGEAQIRIRLSRVPAGIPMRCSKAGPELGSALAGRVS
jgi:hypothetical protein